MAVYRKRDELNGFERFDLVFGGKLRPDNRWVILADLIPWGEIEQRYMPLFVANNGRPAIPLRVALGSLLIKERLKISDEETVEQIRETPYLQYFIGYESYRDEVPFDPSMMVHFRKRLSSTILQEVNNLIVQRQVMKSKTFAKKDDKDGDDEEPGNRGTLIADASCIPEDMRFPVDVTLLDEARRKTEKMIDTLHAAMPAGSVKPRTYRKLARKEFLGFIRNRRPRRRDIRCALKVQLQYLRRDLGLLEGLADKVGIETLTKKQSRDLEVIKELVRQQAEMYRNKGRSVPNRIVSIAKPHVRPIARGKARAMYEFGAKISVSMLEGYTRVERLSWDNYNESGDLKPMLEDYKLRHGVFPEVVCADKIYRNRGNLVFCRDNHIRLSGPRLGRPLRDPARFRAQKNIERDDESCRVAVEGKFGEAKRTYTLDRVCTRLKETSETTIMLVIIVMNLMRMTRDRARSLFASLLENVLALFAWQRHDASEWLCVA